MRGSFFRNERNLFWTLQFAAWSAYGLSSFFSDLPRIDSRSWVSLLAVKMTRALVGLFLSWILYTVYRRRSGRFTRPAPTVFVVVTLSLVLGASWFFIYSYVVAPAMWIEEPIRWAEVPQTTLDYAFVLLAWSGAYFALRQWRQSEIQRQQALEARALASEAQLTALSYQLNPHFLFNALNSIRGLIAENPERARDTVTRFSEFLRHTLVNPPHQETLLEKEIQALRSYLDIEKARFEDRLQVSIHVSPDAARTRVPALVLHPLVENAIKHGVPDESGALRVRLCARVEDAWLKIEVANSGTLSVRHSATPWASERTGIGLENVRKRLSHFYPEAHRFALEEEAGWVRATVEIQQKTPFGNGTAPD